MHKQRLAEERKETTRSENKKFFQDTDLRAKREKDWTSSRAVNHR